MLSNDSYLEFQLSKDLFKCRIRNLTTVTLVSVILMNSLLKIHVLIHESTQRESRGAHCEICFENVDYIFNLIYFEVFVSCFIFVEPTAGDNR